MKMLNLLSQSFPSAVFFINFLTLIIALITPITCKTNNYLLDCGGPTTTLQNQICHTDEDPTFAPPSAYNAATKAAVATTPDPYGVSNQDEVLSLMCKTARTFHAPFTYSFPVNQGPKFVRFTFCAEGTYDETSSDNFFLTVQANGGSGTFTLLRNFSAYLNEKHFHGTYPGPISREFLVMATTSRLNLTFSPTSPAYLGFVNGIEIVDVPDHLYDYLIPPSIEDSLNYSRSPCHRPQTFVGNPTAFTESAPAALETVARVNVGGSDIDSENDSGGLSRTWYSDKEHLIQNFPRYHVDPSKKPKIQYTKSVPEYTAPSSVYQTARFMGPNNKSFNVHHNISWKFIVDSGFDYLVRLHFCEIVSEVTKPGQREFDVLINDQQAGTDIDVMTLTDKEQRGLPACVDYVAASFGDMNSVKVPLLVTLRPETETAHPSYYDVILNGIEIFKLNNTGGNLAGPNPALSPDDVNKPQSSPSDTKNSAHLHTIIAIVVGVLGSLVLIPIIIFALVRWWLKKPGTNETSKWLLRANNSGSSNPSSGTSSLPSHLCNFFTLQQIKVATNNFSDDFVIGVGGFGKVYKGSLEVDGISGGVDEVMVAIKRLNSSSKQGAHEFLTEIKMLTALRHLHLVPLIGFCKEKGEMILVYEYMPLGTLQDHLYQKKGAGNHYTAMPWKLRLMTCIGAARGLHYLHTGTNRMIIHRDVKSTNILLDKNWVAKVADFGISKVGPSTEEGYISTLVKGSIGYLDPEYLRLKQLTHKSDVYSFGAVLFEVLCGRRVMVASLANEQVNLVRYATSCYKEGTLHEIVDPNVRDEIAPDCLMKFGEIANKCVRDHGSERPSMEEVLWSLEFALKLQETAEEERKDNVTSIKLVLDNEDGNSTIDNKSEFFTCRELLSSIGGGATTTHTKLSSDFSVLL